MENIANSSICKNYDTLNYSFQENIEAMTSLR